MKLVIVESPNKCKTIEKYLGPDYKVMATGGHIRDMELSGGLDNLGFYIKKNGDFEPIWKKEFKNEGNIKELKKAKEKADEVILATDPDREGEAIAWHVADVLKLPIETTKRWLFHEITKNGIKKAQENATTINMDLVGAQKARRIIDRVVGYKDSEVLRNNLESKNRKYSRINEKKQETAYTGGRVQSPTLGFITEREKEINEFVPEEYWRITGSFGQDEIIAELDKSIKVKNENEALKVENDLKDAEFIISDLSESPRNIESKPAFTTSTFQQEAVTRYKMSTSRAQATAQELFSRGLITYIRTDSDRLAPEFISSAQQYIEDTYGIEYVGSGHFKAGKGETIQDAHEAIRPTDISLTPENAKVEYKLTNDESKIYKLIYNRALTSLMAAKKEKVLHLGFTGNGYTFKAESATVVFDGFSKVISDNSSSKPITLKENLKKGNPISCNSINKEQKFTQGPARYTEGGIVHLMEEKGIGRPSTYATTIKGLKDKKYIDYKDGKLYPTPKGWLDSGYMKQIFPEIMDSNYTSKMEEELDKIATKELDEKDFLNNFYTSFCKTFEEATKGKKFIKPEPIVTGEKCPICNSDIVVKSGPFGAYACCKNYKISCDFKKTASAEREILDESCPTCGEPLVKSASKYRGDFIRCSNYPTCSYIKNKEKEPEVELNRTCPNCGHKLVIKHKRKSGKPFIGCSNYSEGKCTYTENIKKDDQKDK